jgi:hypothetical protein
VCSLRESAAMSGAADDEVVTNGQVGGSPRLVFDAQQRDQNAGQQHRAGGGIK